MKISVISTTYNRKDLLLQTIESVQKSILQPLTDISFEYIIYDDASTDGTEEIFTNNPWENVTYIRGTENKGPSYGRNRAIAEASGDYIFLIDSDDILLQRTLFHFAKVALEHPDREWFASDFLHVDNDLKYIVGDDYYTWEFKDPTDMLQAIFKGEHFLQSNVFFKKSLFIKAGMFDESMRMGEDIDLFIRFLLLGAMPLMCPFVSHLHRFHATNLSAEMNEEKHKAFIKSLYEQKYRNSITLA